MTRDAEETIELLQAQGGALRGTKTLYFPLQVEDAKEASLEDLKASKPNGKTDLNPIAGGRDMQGRRKGYLPPAPLANNIEAILKGKLREEPRVLEFLSLPCKLGFIPFYNLGKEFLNLQFRVPCSNSQILSFLKYEKKTSNLEFLDRKLRVKVLRESISNEVKLREFVQFNNPLKRMEAIGRQEMAYSKLAKARSNCYEDGGYDENAYGESHHRNGHCTHRSQMAIGNFTC
ncbi:hypothetical protein M9H77_29501 [Catharanthus roseus]|uniref:Uncharacterized protein n=1 Tax=Catharanthus roseus TaxID=4058 RepID=A0ACB9ZUX4_CATRO|nr:hypothetical protein M9H77_29501 [Catharanthus roseus]